MPRKPAQAFRMKTSLMLLMIFLSESRAKGQRSALSLKLMVLRQRNRRLPNLKQLIMIVHLLLLPKEKEVKEIPQSPKRR